MTQYRMGLHQNDQFVKLLKAAFGNLHFERRRSS